MAGTAIYKPWEEPLGRPTTYDPRYCEMVTELGARGKSLTQISAILDIPRTTLLRWGEKHSEFRTALNRAKELEQAWWEEVGQEGLGKKFFQAALWKTSMQARFRDDYTERKTSVIEGNPDRPVKTVVEYEIVDPKAIDASEATSG